MNQRHVSPYFRFVKVRRFALNVDKLNSAISMANIINPPPIKPFKPIFSPKSSQAVKAPKTGSMVNIRAIWEAEVNF